MRLYALAIVGALGLLFLLAFLQQRDDQAQGRMTITTGACPPPAAGSTDYLVMTIKTSADGGPVVLRCARIAHRYMQPQ